VVFLHGNPTWGFLWRKVMLALDPASFRCMAPDLMGLGYSSRITADEHTLEAHAAWFGGWLDAMQLREVIVVAQDWGGPIALRALADRPGLAAAIVLTNTVAGPPRADARPTFFHRFANSRGLSDLVFRLGGFPQRTLWMAQHDRSSISGVVADAYLYPLRGLANNVAPLALARMVPLGADHPSLAGLSRCRDFMAAFAGPIELVWGVRDPILGRVISHLERTLPDARVSRHEAGHFSPEEIPGPIADAVRSAAARIG
jgi:haloalkane dehalogenase